LQTHVKLLSSSTAPTKRCLALFAFGPEDVEELVLALLLLDPSPCSSGFTSALSTSFRFSVRKVVRKFLFVKKSSFFKHSKNFPNSLPLVAGGRDEGLLRRLSESSKWFVEEEWGGP
jgi:hypothetical protein